MAYLIAEIGNNHEGDVAQAMRLMELAASSGAHAVKFQHFRAERLVHPSLPAMVGEGTQLERMRALELADDDWRRLEEHARALEVEFIVSIFDPALAARWQHLRYLKIASGDLDYRALVSAAAVTGAHLLLSTGASSLDEVESAIQGLNKDRLTVLHCVSEYPTPDNRANLGRIAALRKIHARVGYSDHTRGILACVGAVAMGAEVIEKHFTDERRDFGDHRHAATPEEFGALAEQNQRMELLKMRPFSTDLDIRRAMRRGAYAAKPVQKGKEIARDDVLALRPRTGRHPESVIGRRACRDYEALEAL